MRLKHIAIIGSLFPILISIVLFFGVLISAEDDDGGGNYSSSFGGMNLSAEVLKHQPMVEKYAREYGISEYVNVLLAIIQVESGGTAEDVMQSSESLGLPPNSLDTESSIKQGCKYFASLLSSCKNQGIDDLNVAIQSYNYGGGYVGYVAGKGKKHTFNLAESFAREKSGGKKVTYTNPIAVAKNGPAAISADSPCAEPSTTSRPRALTCATSHAALSSKRAIPWTSCARLCRPWPKRHMRQA